MTTLAEIVRAIGPVYREKFADGLLPSHRQALTAITQCRTAALGGQLYHCQSCAQSHYQYHSCRNRHCPQCQQQAGQQWLQRQQQMRLPTHYFMLTFTLPQALRRIARQHQRLLYTLLFRCAAEATQQLARDKRYVGGQIGMVGVLHTWGRNLAYHPHVHFLVPGGGLDENLRWQATTHNFFLPVKALSKLFRAKMRDALTQAALPTPLPLSIWQSDWVVHSQPVGHSGHAFTYLAPYIFRVALSNRRLLSFQNDRVTFRFRESDSGRWRICTLDAYEFLRRFLQHVLPKRFVKVRYYGLFSPAKRKQLELCRHQLPPLHTVTVSSQPASTSAAPNAEIEASACPSSTDTCRFLCPVCGGPLRFVRRFEPIPHKPP